MRYRILKLGELIRKGDQVFDNHNNGGGWTKTMAHGCIMLDPELVGSYRRPLKSRKRSQQQTTAKASRKPKSPKR
jgi:hypothetical protein